VFHVAGGQYAGNAVRKIKKDEHRHGDEVDVIRLQCRNVL
jgi:hypothetical protein